MSDCVFCKIAAKALPATLLHEDEAVVAFPDLNAQAPFHALVVPRRHVASLAEADDEALLGRLNRVAAQLARDRGYGESGFRVVTNVGRDAGQSVGHLHYHVLGGRHLGLPWR